MGGGEKWMLGDGVRGLVGENVLGEEDTYWTGDCYLLEVLTCWKFFLLTSDSLARVSHISLRVALGFKTKVQFLLCRRLGIILVISCLPPQRCE